MCATSASSAAPPNTRPHSHRHGHVVYARARARARAPRARTHAVASPPEASGPFSEKAFAQKPGRRRQRGTFGMASMRRSFGESPNLSHSLILNPS